MTNASSYAPSLYSWCARSSYSSELRNGVAIFSKPPAHEGTPIVQLRRTEVQWEIGVRMIVFSPAESLRCVRGTHRCNLTCQGSVSLEKGKVRIERSAFR